MHHKISIIMPVKNTSSYLDACLDSIRQQDYPHWELLAVDDHSDDSCPQIIASHAREDVRIVPVENCGNGIIDALRTGYGLSSGDYITRMDSDDYMPAHKLSTMLGQLALAGKGHIATGLVKYFSETELGQGYLLYQDWLNELSSTGRNFDEIYKECPIPSPCWMVHRDDFELAGAFRSHEYPEDYDLCFRFFHAGLRVVPASEVLHYWRDHGLRSSRTHEHYADNSFIRLKMQYFLLLQRDRHKQLVVWGAGSRAKAIAMHLIAAGEHFDWICNNEKKVGKDIYGVFLKPVSCEMLGIDVQVILTMANKEEQRAVNDQISSLNMLPNENIFWMC